MDAGSAPRPSVLALERELEAGASNPGGASQGGSRTDALRSGGDELYTRRGGPRLSVRVGPYWFRHEDHCTYAKPPHSRTEGGGEAGEEADGERGELIDATRSVI